MESAITGSLSSLIATSLVYPLDLSKTVYQSQLDDKHAPDDGHADEQHYASIADCLRKIYGSQGLAGLYRGLGSTLVNSTVQSFTYFYWYSTVIKKYSALLKRRGAKVSTAEELLLGMVSAGISQLFTTPISTLSTLQQLSDADKSILAIGEEIVHKHGITNLWRGLKISLMLTINPSITFTCFNQIKSLLLIRNGGQREFLKPWQSFFLGIVSKMLSTVITQPLIRAKVIIQKNSNLNLFTVLKLLYEKNGGFLSFYKGLLPQLLKGILMQGLVFMIKDQLVMLLRLLRSTKLRKIAI